LLPPVNVIPPSATVPPIPPHLITNDINNDESNSNIIDNAATSTLSTNTEAAVHPAFRALNGVPNAPIQILRRPQQLTQNSSDQTRPTIHDDDAQEQPSLDLCPRRVSFPWNHEQSPQQEAQQHNDDDHDNNIDNERTTMIQHATRINRQAYSNVTSWTKACFNPDDANKVLNPNTAKFISWFADNPEYGYTECFPVQLSIVITYGNCDNAYQNSWSPSEPCFLEANEAYISWYYKRTGIRINPRTHVIPALRAIQGHPEAGRLFQDLILSVLLSPLLNFMTTTHERNLYRGNKSMILLLAPVLQPLLIS
jgi:hypothetical protein